jgi:hypothetical protein
MNNDVTYAADECSIHSTRPRHGFTRFWPRPRGRGWGDPHARDSFAGDIAVSLARVPR